MRAIKLLSLILVFQLTAPAFGGSSKGGGGSSGPKCSDADHPCNKKRFGGYSCNCGSCGTPVGTGFKAYGAYPEIAECQSEGAWKKADSTCHSGQPGSLPPNTMGKRAVAGMCWELWCSAGNYFFARMDKEGGRTGGVDFSSGCKKCPAGEEIVPDFSNPAKIIYNIRAKG